MSNNVIDLTSRLKRKKENEQKNKKKKTLKKNLAELSEEASEIKDISEIRRTTIASDRRKVKRTILTEFLGTHIVIPNAGLQKVLLFDISTSGVSFDIEKKSGFFKEGEEVAMRIYLNHNAYFPFTLKIQHSRYDEEEEVYRHGANFQKGSVNEEALFHFVKFLETVATSLKKDTGDILVSNLTQN